MLTPRSLLSFTATIAFSLVSGATPGDEPTLEQRLEKLVQALEQARVDAHVPGMSIAIVQDDEVVLARGFGLADVEGERPADAETIYAVGSTTKAFTATLVGMLVDEGKLSWDDPVTDYLPYFDLQVRSDDEGAACTLRDLLSHRHGFSRMSLLWLAPKAPREKILHTAAGAEPWDDFRARFHYCNVTYLAAGEAAGAAAESSWDELIVDRIFEPLGMTSSTLRTSEAQEDPRLALGYEWDRRVEELDRKRMVELDAIGPAGSINSNVVDMAQWVRLQLGRGEVDGMRLVSPERIRETWSPQIAIGRGVSYGLGWMLREHDGRKVVEHGGNIDGFSAQVTLVPEEDVGYVLLMNLDVSPLQQASIPLVLDALFDPWPEEPAVADGVGEIDLDEYVGVYVANFATFRDEEFEVRHTESGLALHVPSQQTFELEAPDDEGRWGFTLTDQISVSFDRDDSGRIVGLTLHQSGFHFEVPRKGAEIEPDAPAEELRRYTGTFVRANGGKRVEIVMERGRLAIIDKGNLLTFQPPDAEGHAALRAHAEHGATFDVGADGGVDSFVFHGSSGDQLFTRLTGTLGADLPTLEEVLALRRTDARTAALDSGGDTRVTGEVFVPQAGLRGELTICTRGGDHYASRVDFGEFGRVETAAAGAEAWTYNTLRGREVLKGDELTQAILDHPAAVEGDWSDYFDRIEVVRNDRLGERPVHVVRLTRGEFPSRSYWVDAENGDVLRVELTLVEGSIRVPATITHSDFREIDGIRRPMRTVLENPESGRTVLTFEHVESGLDLPDDVFHIAE